MAETLGMKLEKQLSHFEAFGGALYLKGLR
jgi:hypothetical protein